MYPNDPGKLLLLMRTDHQLQLVAMAQRLAGAEHPNVCSVLAYTSRFGCEQEAAKSA